MHLRQVVFVSCLAAALPARAGDEQTKTPKPILDVTVEVDFGRDEGQNFGSLFEAYDADGNIVAGAGFVGAYNTQPRSDRGRLQFFIKPKEAAYEIETLPRVNNNTGVYLSEHGETIAAHARNGRDNRFFTYDAAAKEWRADESIAGYDIRVAGKLLHAGAREVTYAGERMLALGEDRPGTNLRENYYALGTLLLRVQDAAAGEGSNRLVACRWSPYDKQPAIDPGAGVPILLRSHGEFVYAFGQLEDEIVAATNTGGVYAFDGTEWRVLNEPASHSYQVYSMINYYERLLLGHYPSGEILEYSGRELRQLHGWPPVMAGVSNRAREAQTMTIYGGDLYAGVWPWAEVWRYDRNAAQWQFAQRMFSHPEPTDATVHPYENETKALDEVLNFWGQRVTSLVPFGESLFVATSSKGGQEFDPKFEFLTDGKWQDYGKVYRLTLPGQLSAAIDWVDRPTTLRFTLTDGEMTIRQDGAVKAELAVDTGAVLSGQPARISWGRGVYGRLAGELRKKESNFDRPFLGAYLNFSQLFTSLETNDERQRAIDAALDRFRDSGLNVVMPYVTSTSGTAAYRSAIIVQHEFGDWDPLAYLVAAAHARQVEVYPVFCVLACGHDEPAGILAEHPEWALRKPDGQPMGHICPANADARRWVTSVIAEVAERYPVEGVLLDYLRYYNRPTLLDAASQAAFEQYRAQHPNEAEDVLLQRFREEGLTALAREISMAARAARPGLQIALYSWGPHVAQNHQVGQAWPTWSREGCVDMVNISGYCYPDNYGARYLDVFSQRIGDAIELNRQHAGRADITFCLGVVTSHGRIQAASWVDDYLTRAAAEGVSGTAIFTWSTLQPFLDEVNRGEYIPRFAESVSGR